MTPKARSWCISWALMLRHRHKELGSFRIDPEEACLELTQEHIDAINDELVVHDLWFLADPYDKPWGVVTLKELSIFLKKEGVKVDG